jgi:hypothetical protein
LAHFINISSICNAIHSANQKLTSCLNGQKTVGFCSFLANFSQQFYCRLAKRYVSRDSWVLRYINISFIWVLACSLCTVTTALLFNPVNAYYHIARYSILVSFIIGSLASILVSIEAFKKKEWQSSIKAVAMVLIFIACFWVTFIIFVVSYQGV